LSRRWHLKRFAEEQPRARRRAALLAVLMLSVALGGCMVGPDYKRPPVVEPAGFKSSLDSARDDPERAEGPVVANGDAPLIAPEWWRLYREPELDLLIATATASNQTLKQAVAAVDQARALARVARSYLAPTISADPTFTRQRTSPNRRSTITGQAVGVSATFNDWLVPVDLTYELDVWGRVRRGLQSARAQAVASADDEAMVRLTVQTDVAQYYYTLRLLDAQSEMLTQTVA
jgi:outer membrane protein, multidrug efflux system